MKKQFFAVFFFMILSNSLFGQTDKLMISEIADPSDQYLARFIELYNAGTTSINLANLCVKRQNSGISDGWFEVLLTESGRSAISPGEFLYIAYNEVMFYSCYGFYPDITDDVANVGGDDGVFLWNDATEEIIDAYGVVDQDGTGTAWEYTDGHAERKGGTTGPNPTWTASEWDISSPVGTAGMGTWETSLPVELNSFSAHYIAQSIILEWTTQSEVNNLGFILERADENKVSWQIVASYRTDDALKGHGNTSSRTEYTFIDITVEAGRGYYYRLSDVSIYGDVTTYPPLFIQLDALPEKSLMEKAYPNPFNPKTYITYYLAEATQVKIAVFDMLGRTVKELHNGRQVAGNYQVYWNGTNENGMKAPSGAYIIRMQTEKETQIQKVMFIK